MSTEKIGISNNSNLPPLETPNFKVGKIVNKVDINDLLAKVRKEKHKEHKANLIFFSLFSALIVVVGTILSF